jgi:hypothetical protein
MIKTLLRQVAENNLPDKERVASTDQSGQCSLPQQAWEDGQQREAWDPQYTSVFTRGDTTNMPEPEYLFTGDDPLTVLSLKREEVEKKLKNIKASGAPGPHKVWSRVLHDMAVLLAGLLTITDGGSAPSSRKGAKVRGRK